MNEHQLAEFVVEWLRERNGSQLNDAFGEMKLRDFENLHGELAEILKHCGRPPNWVKR